MVEELVGILVLVLPVSEGRLRLWTEAEGGFFFYTLAEVPRGTRSEPVQLSLVLLHHRLPTKLRQVHLLGPPTSYPRSVPVRFPTIYLPQELLLSVHLHSSSPVPLRFSRYFLQEYLNFYYYASPYFLCCLSSLSLASSASRGFYRVIRNDEKEAFCCLKD